MWEQDSSISFDPESRTYHLKTFHFLDGGQLFVFGDESKEYFPDTPENPFKPSDLH